VHGRFPAGRGEIPDQAVAHVARLVDVPPDELGLYEWDGRMIKAHRADVRRYFGFRECSVADADKATEWLAANVCEKERQAGQVREELLAHLKGEQIEPPATPSARSTPRSHHLAINPGKTPCTDANSSQPRRRRLLPISGVLRLDP
jgi:Domain of unknown function (DUF4158)